MGLQELPDPSACVAQSSAFVHNRCLDPSTFSVERTQNSGHDLHDCFEHGQASKKAKLAALELELMSGLEDKDADELFG
jgi:hypothetical protein